MDDRSQYQPTRQKSAEQPSVLTYMPRSIDGIFWVSDDQITPSQAWRTTELLYPMELVGRSQFVLLSRLI